MEARQFMPEGALHDGFGPMINFDDLPAWTLEPLGHRDARRLFLARFRELFG